MKCGITDKESCTVSRYRDLLINYGEVGEQCDSIEDLERAYEKTIQEKIKDGRRI